MIIIFEEKDAFRSVSGTNQRQFRGGHKILYDADEVYFIDNEGFIDAIKDRTGNCEKVRAFLNTFFSRVVRGVDGELHAFFLKEVQNSSIIVDETLYNNEEIGSFLREEESEYDSLFSQLEI